MKKRIWITLSVALMLCLACLTAGCGEAADSTPDATDDAVQETQAPEEDPTKPNLGDYRVDIKSFRMAKSYDKKPVIIITYGYTNFSDTATSFSLAVSDKAYQNDIELNKAYVLDDSAAYNSDNQSKDVRNGATLDIEVAYELNDEATDVLVEVKELISFSDDTVSKTFTLAEGGSAQATEAPAEQKGEPNLGDYLIEIKSFRMAKSYDKKPVIIITYGYTNFSDKAASFSLAVSDKAYQNDIELNKAYVLDDSAAYNSDNQSKDVRNGATLDIEVAYELNDETTDVLVEVKELFSFGDDTVSKTFPIA